MKYGEASTRVATNGLRGAKDGIVDNSLSTAEERPAMQPRCVNCGGTGHNAQTCQADAAEDSASDASTWLISSPDNSDGSDGDSG
jgi:hypothetical protein